MKNLITLLEANPQEKFLIILAYIAGVIILIFITRAIFSIGTIVRNLKAQTRLLATIAEKQGVPTDTIKKELYAAEGEHYEPSKKLVKEEIK